MTGGPPMPGRVTSGPTAFRMALRRAGVRCHGPLLLVSVPRQRLWECHLHPSGLLQVARSCIISTSRFGIGQQEGSYRTPLGLHRVARRIGGGYPIGTVFEGRRAVGLTRQGRPAAAICHRILWLEGLEPGMNRGGSVDSFRRYVYIHGFGDELTLGKPASRGCIHMAAADLIPLFDRTRAGSLVWITHHHV